MTGNKKKRKDIDKGLAQQQQFANQAIATQQPFNQYGAPATNQLAFLSGLGTQDQNNAAYQAFLNSPFYTGGQNSFNAENDALQAHFGGQGNLFSSATFNAREDARNRNFQNAFAQYLGNTGNVSGIGQQAAANQANILTGMGSTAYNAGLAKAGTRQGVLGAFKQVADIGSNIGNAFTGF